MITRKRLSSRLPIRCGAVLLLALSACELPERIEEPSRDLSDEDGGMIDHVVDEAVVTGHMAELSADVRVSRWHYVARTCRPTSDIRQVAATRCREDGGNLYKSSCVASCRYYNGSTLLNGCKEVKYNCYF